MCDSCNGGAVSGVCNVCLVCAACDDLVNCDNCHACNDVDDCFVRIICDVDTVFDGGIIGENVNGRDWD